jgi:hypothetical protein
MLRCGADFVRLCPGSRFHLLRRVRFRASPPLYLSDRLVGVIKPLNWTSSDAVSHLRGILEQDAPNRGVWNPL